MGCSYSLVIFPLSLINIKLSFVKDVCKNVVSILLNHFKYKVFNLDLSDLWNMHFINFFFFYDREMLILYFVTI